MHSYAAFGTQLNSTLELPELHRTTATARDSWTLRVDEHPRALAPVTLLGAETVFGSVHVCLSSSESAFRLDFDDTGTFEVDPVARAITWYPGRRRDGEAVRADILGRVMAVAAHAEGGLALHASAVTIAGRAVAFLGPKYAGKSTIAMSLVGVGARLLTDDTLVVRFDALGNAVASPGVHRVRLWDDSSRALGAPARSTLGAKPSIDELPPHQLALSDVPLAACYVLHPIAAPTAEPIAREPLSLTQAALACVGFSKLGALLGGAESGRVLDRAALLVRTTPFHLASVGRDLDRLEGVAQALLAWHQASAER